MYNVKRRYLYFILLFVGAIAIGALAMNFAPKSAYNQDEDLSISPEINETLNTSQSPDELLAECERYINQSQYSHSEDLLDNAEIQNVSVIFYIFPSDSKEQFNQEEINDFLKIINCCDRNDSIYSVREYYQDISYNQLDFNVTASAKVYNNPYNLFYVDMSADITINIYPVRVGSFDKSSKFWPRCRVSYRSVVIPKDVEIATICHEVLHTFEVYDLYSEANEKIENILIKSGADWVGAWSLMATSSAVEPQYPLVYSMQYVTNLTQSNYFDSQKSNIEIVNDNAKINLKAVAYADKNDTICARINASDLGFKDAKDIYFMIEYRKPNGNKDLNTPTRKESLIIYRVNEKQPSNLYAETQEETLVYVFKKYNVEKVVYAQIREGDTFGSETNIGYNTIFMPNGENTKIVIKNIKFNSDNSCSFELDVPNNSSEIIFSGALQDNHTPVSDCTVWCNGVIIAYTDVNGVFDIELDAPNTIQFIKDGQLIKEYYVAKSEKNIILDSNTNNCRLEIKNSFSSVIISINGTEKEYNSSSIELVLNIGDQIKIITQEYKDYEFTYSGQKNIDITLAELDKPNIIERTIDNIRNNAQSAIDSLSSSIDNFYRGIKKWFESQL